MRKTNETLECRFLAGSQALYGDETLRQAAQQSGETVALLKASSELSVGLVWKRVLIGSAELRRACIEAQSTDDCVGIAIDDTPIAESFKREFRWNRAHGRLAQGVAR